MGRVGADRSVDSIFGYPALSYATMSAVEVAEDADEVPAMPNEEIPIPLDNSQLLLSAFLDGSHQLTIEIDSDAPVYNQSFPIRLNADQARQLIAVLTALLAKGGA